jgi:hypothetical protein
MKTFKEITEELFSNHEDTIKNVYFDIENDFDGQTNSILLEFKEWLLGSYGVNYPEFEDWSDLASKLSFYF